MTELRNPVWIKCKGALFLVLGTMSGVLLIRFRPLGPGFVILFALSVWSFCRFYYFAFYVIEHFVDSNYRFSGLLSFVRYLLRTSRPGR